ncbi:MAG: hypothetical protein AAGN66_05100 [Acidobacteriota bacterium]
MQRSSALRSRRRGSGLAGAWWILGMAWMVGFAGAEDPPELGPSPRALSGLGLEALQDLGTPWPNPYLSFLPEGATPDLRYWRAVMAEQARERRRAAPRGTTTVVESEPNDTSASANGVDGFGTGPGETASVNVAGTFLPPPTPNPLGPFPEDDGALPLASDTGLVAGSAVRITGTIGDGPYGSGGTGSGDHDFFRIPNVVTGQLIVVDVDTAMPLGDLDPFIALYDSAGNILALNEDEDGAVNRDSFLAVPATSDGDVYLSIAGSLFPFAAVLADPFDPATGFGVGSEGNYSVTVALEWGDQDWYAFDLEPCDILGVSLLGAGRELQLLGPGGELLVASAQDLTGIHPPSSPLPGGGRAALSFVATLPGRYALRVLGADGPDYSMELRLFRHPSESSPVAKRLFVDFDGATVDPSIFTGDPGNATLSPLASFLDRWGLSPGDEDAVIDATLAALRENLLAGPAAGGPNLGFDLELLNSRDHPDPFGEPGVSRLIIGGSIAELGIPTIGIAQSIDPGNLETAETGVVLLDLLSGSVPDPNSLNTFPLAPGATRLELVGLALGNIAAHEAGHFFGNFHTEQGNPLASLMDRGGNLPNTLGLGDDGIFGTDDDVDVDFEADHFESSERFAGVEDTLAVVSCGCTTSAGLFGDGFETGDFSRWGAVFPRAGAISLSGRRQSGSKR